MHRFERTTRVHASAEEAFSLSLSVEFHLESFAESGERIVGGLKSGELGLHDTVTWQARHFGIWWTMSSVISEYDRPRYFVDQQLKGPFKFFCHEHHFESSVDGCTIRDVVQLDAPFGPLGAIVQKLILNRYVEDLIDLRNAQLVERLTK